MSYKLDRANVEDMYELTPLQSGILFHYLQDPDNNHYHEQIRINIQGELFQEHFIKAWQQVVAQNEVLRTVFRWENLSTPVQIVLKQIELNYTFHDFSSERSGDQNEKLDQLLFIDRQQTFDLHLIPFRITLVSLESSCYELIISNHHILYDGFSNVILLEEFVRNYELLIQGEEKKTVRKSKFKDFVTHIQEKGTHSEKESFWKNYLQGFEAHETLTSLEASDKKNSASGNVHRIIDDELQELIKSFAAKHQITPAVLYYAAWGILLQRYHNTDDILFGVPMSVRSNQVHGIERMVGLYINTLPIRINTSRDDKVSDLLRMITEYFYNQEFFQNTALVDIKTYCGTEDSIRFNSILAIENYSNSLEIKSEKAGLALSLNSAFERTNYDMTVRLSLLGKAELDFIYNSSLYSEKFISQIANHYLHILEQLISEFDPPVSDIEVLSNEEKRVILSEFSGDKNRNSDCVSLRHVLQQYVTTHPNRICLHEYGINHKRSMTLSEMYNRSNDVASYLLANGLRHQERVAVLMDNSIEMVYTLIGVLMAGGVYVALDPEYPVSRITTILEDCECKYILTDSVVHKPLEVSAKMINVSQIANEPELDHSIIDRVSLSPDDLAYILYTSGSTGKPKGVMIEYVSMFQLLNCLADEYNWNDEDVFMLKTSFTFDVSIPELFGWLLSGSLLVIPQKEESKDPAVLLEIIELYKVSQINFTPSLFNVFLDYLSQTSIEQLNSVKHIYLAGERLLESTVDKFHALGLCSELHNLYGPTEATVYSTHINVNEFLGERVTIGHPLPHVEVYIVDEHMRLCPIGANGQIAIAGSGVAKGYFGNPSLTDMKFIPNPLKEGKLYLSGDYGRWLPNGQIDYLGRMDGQRKLRGYRLEIGEVENVILNFPGVKETAVIIAKDTNGVDSLYAFFTSRQNEETENLKQYMVSKLPFYMVPNILIQLDHLPKSSSGKVNKKELEKILERERPIDSNAKSALHSPTEHGVAQLWSEILDVDQSMIGTESNFFVLGGHSLKAIKLIGSIHKRMGVQLNLHAVFACPDLCSMASMIDDLKSNKVELSKRSTASHTDLFLASNAEQRMWVMDKMNPGTYHISTCFNVKGHLDYSVLNQTMNQIMDKYGSLRTNFELLDDQLYQRVHPVGKREFEMEQLDLPNHWTQSKVEEKIQSIQSKLFDLEKDLLFRFVLLNHATEGKILTVTFHHIICDEQSISMIMNVFSHLYRNLVAGKPVLLPEVTSHAKDFAEWQRQQYQKGNSGKEYWTRQLQRNMPITKFPVDFITNDVGTSASRTIHAYLEKEPMNKLKDSCETRGVSLFVYMVAALKVLLHKNTREKDIMIGTPVSERDSGSWSDSVGLFQNTIPLRTQFKDDASFNEILTQVNSNFIEALAFKHYPFNRMIEDLNMDSSMREPLFTVMIVMHDEELNTDTIELSDDLLLVGKNHIHGLASYDLVFYIKPERDHVKIELEYNTSLYLPERMHRMLKHFIAIITNSMTFAYDKLSNLQMLDQPEERLLIHEYNDTASNYDNHIQVFHYIDEQARLFPDHTCLTFENNILTYKELVDQTNALATYLYTEKNVKPGFHVGVFMERSHLSSIAMIGTWKSGACYVPLDPSYPQERIHYMIQDAGIQLLITDDVTDLRGIPSSIQVIRISSIFLDNYSKERTKTKITMNPSDRAVVLYTSGSTGLPKGVMLSHKNLTAFMHWALEEFSHSSYSVGYSVTSYCFDLSLFEMLLPLCSGKKVRILKSSMDIIKYLKEDTDILLNTVPSVVEELVKKKVDMSSITVLNMAGEPIPSSVTEALDYKKIEVRNLYGPTEDTVYSSCYHIHEMIHPIPIGRPILNTQIYLLDEDLNLVPNGVSGEICISGDGIALGYWNKNDMTSDRFVENPFTVDSNFTLYRTGDLGKRLEDGNILFMGRKDNQIKIKGYRIELEEIETVINQHDKVQAAAVLKKTNGEHEYLAAYITLKHYLPNDDDVKQQHPMEMNEGTLSVVTRCPNVDEAGLYQYEKCYHELFEEQAMRNPDHISYIYDGTEFTYKEVNEMSNSLARYMRKRTTIEIEKPVVLLMNRSVHFASAILAIWKCGAAYVPIDPSYPDTRILAMIDQIDPVLILAESETLSDSVIDQLNLSRRNPLVIDQELDDIIQESKQNLNLLSDPCQLAYIFFTSGSTGTPKGAMIEHRGMLNHMYGKITDLSLDSGCIIAQNAKQSFDISIWQLFTSALIGGKTIIYSNEQVLDSRRFIHRIHQDKVTVLEVVPSYLSLVLDHDDVNAHLDLDCLMVTGEQLYFNLVQRWFKRFPNVPMVNAYGPTEASDDITHHWMNEPPIEPFIPVGSPLPNTTIYVVDENMQIVPLGEKGEICVAGVGIGRGYLNDITKTNEVFLENLFSQGNDTKLYRTGDIGIMLPDMTLRFIGRKDQQIKLRGHRIELGEIETAIMQIVDIKEVVVVHVYEEDVEEGYLCAYYTTTGNRDDNQMEALISKHLSKHLPLSMIPENYRRLDEFTLNANGKIDRKQLPLPTANRKKQSEEIKFALRDKLPFFMIPEMITVIDKFPRTPNGKVDRKALERLEDFSQIKKASIDEVQLQTLDKYQLSVLQAWKAILDKNEISMDENFFDQGGNSFKLMRIFDVLSQEYDELKVTDLFTYPNIQELAGYLANLSKDNSSLLRILNQYGMEFKPIKPIRTTSSYSVPTDCIVIEGVRYEQLKKISESINGSLNAIVQAICYFLTKYMVNDPTISIQTYDQERELICVIQPFIQGVEHPIDLFKLFAQSKVNVQKTYNLNLVQYVENKNKILPIVISGHEDEGKLNALIQAFKLLFHYVDDGESKAKISVHFDSDLIDDITKTQFMLLFEAILEKTAEVAI